MKRILFIVVMLLSLKATSQITNITGAEPRANLVVTTVTAGKYVLVAEKSGTGQRKLYWVDIDSVSSGSGGGGGGGGATPQLDNLGTTSINAALLPQVGIDLGSTTLPFRNIRFYGSGTFGSHSFNLAGTPTGHRTITFPDADISVARTNASQTFTGVQTFSSNPVFSAVSTGQVPYATTAGAITSSNNLYFSGTRLIVNGNTETGNIFTIRRDLTGLYSFMRMNNTSDAAIGGYIDFGDAASSGFYPYVIYATDNTTGIYTSHNYRVNDGASSIGARYNVANQAGSSALANASAKLFSWESNGTAKMTMDVDGDLGIGTATPDSLLHVAGGLKVTGGINANALPTAPGVYALRVDASGNFSKADTASGSGSRVSTQYDNSTTTLGNVTGLTANVAAGKTYRFEAKLYTTSNVAGGIKTAIAGTATATNIIYEGLTTDAGLITQSRATALATSVGAVTAVTAAYVLVTGTITVNAAGTITVQAAANAATGTTSVLVGSTFVLTEML